MSLPEGQESRLCCELAGHHFSRNVQIASMLNAWTVHRVQQLITQHGN